MASLHSGPGIWAHETGHLLGLEDRYDPNLRPAGGSEVLSRGGLGRFSLMASGAWGTGGSALEALRRALDAALDGTGERGRKRIQLFEARLEKLIENWKGKP